MSHFSYPHPTPKPFIPTNTHLPLQQPSTLHTSTTFTHMHPMTKVVYTDSPEIRRASCIYPISKALNTHTHRALHTYTQRGHTHTHIPQHLKPHIPTHTATHTDPKSFTPSTKVHWLGAVDHACNPRTLGGRGGQMT